MINEVQRNEFVAAEELLLSRIEKLSPLAKPFIMGSANVKEKIDQAEEALLACMKENGMIDGKLLGELLSAKFPQACQWVNVPDQDFRLSDELNNLLTLLFGG